MNPFDTRKTRLILRMLIHSSWGAPPAMMKGLFRVTCRDISQYGLGAVGSPRPHKDKERKRGWTYTCLKYWFDATPPLTTTGMIFASWGSRSDTACRASNIRLPKCSNATLMTSRAMTLRSSSSTSSGSRRILLSLPACLSQWKETTLSTAVCSPVKLMSMDVDRNPLGDSASGTLNAHPHFVGRLASSSPLFLGGA